MQKKQMQLLVGVIFLVLVLFAVNQITGNDNNGEAEGLSGEETMDQEPEQAEEAGAGEDGDIIAEGPFEGQLAPDFLLLDLEGVEHSLAEYRGKIVVMNFWNSSCGYCLQELPVLDDLQEEFAGEIKVLKINVNDAVQTVEELWAEQGYKTTVLLGNNEIAETYMVRAIPDTLVIDREGIIAKRLLGAQPQQIFLEAINDVL